MKVVSGLFQDKNNLYYVKKIESKELPVWYDIGIISKKTTAVSHQVLTAKEITLLNLKRISLR